MKKYSKLLKPGLFLITLLLSLTANTSSAFASSGLSAATDFNLNQILISLYATCTEYAILIGLL